MEWIAEPVTRSHHAKRVFLSFGGLGVLALLLAAMTFNAFHSSRERQEAEKRQLHTMRVLLVAGQLRSALNEAIRGERGYLITRDVQFLKAYDTGKAVASPLLQDLRTLTRDSARERHAIDALAHRMPHYFAVLRRTISFVQAGDIERATAVVKSGAGRREIEALLAIVTQIEGEERRLLTLRATFNDQATRASELADYALVALGFAFLAIVIGATIAAAAASKRSVAMEAELRRLATTDELTGLLNRRALLATVDAELGRAARNGTPTSIVLVDLDHFKRINDRHGHGGGDQALCAFARVASATVRVADIIGRLGGEEFGILMPDTGHAEAAIVTERLRSALATRPIMLDTGVSVEATISAGVAQQLPGEDRDRMIVRADEALYEAKHAGRNRVRLAA